MKQVNRKKIIEELNQNKLAVLPTDTVYGLMAKLSKQNEERLNIFKGRNKEQRISIIFASKEEVFKYIDDLNEERKKLIDEKFPGKYTFIVNLKEEFTKQYGFKRVDFGIRVTSNNILQDIIKETGPLLATSCNYTKEEICVDISDIERIFKNKDISVFYTEKGTNVPSSIIKLNDKKISTIR